MDNDSLKPRAGNTFRIIFRPAAQLPKKLPGQAFTLHHGGTPPVRARAADLDARLLARQHEEFRYRMLHVGAAALMMIAPAFLLWGVGLISSLMLVSIVMALIFATAFAAYRLDRAVRSHYEGDALVSPQDSTL